MARGLDHIVHAVHDLDAAAALYRRLGFTVGARNRHPWGTHNCIVQLPGFFIELLAVVEPEKIAPPRPEAFSFGDFARRFLARRQGLAMLVLESSDAADDREAFRRADIGDYELFRFEREGKRPDGGPVRVGFSLAFAHDPKAPDIGYFVCQQHHPENFWNPAFQQHANTACAIEGVVLVAENPTDHHIFLSAFAGERELSATSTGVTVSTPRGSIQVMDPAGFRIHYDLEPPDISGGATLAALRLRVRNREIAKATLRQAQIAAPERMSRIIVDPSVAMGATLVFESV
jgi:catechol 2,3-dioxygenase-like lactoylglutathione lyase family enzyme